MDAERTRSVGDSSSGSVLGSLWCYKMASLPWRWGRHPTHDNPTPLDNVGSLPKQEQEGNGEKPTTL